MENTFKFKFCTYDLVIGDWPQIFIDNFAPDFIDACDYIIIVIQNGHEGFNYGGDEGFTVNGDEYRGFIVSGDEDLIDSGDESNYSTESGPVYS